MIRQVLRNTFERFPAAAQLYRGVRDMLDRRRPPVQTPWGFTLAGDFTMAAGAFEPAETQVVRHLLAGVDVFVNVGANIGYYCCHAASLGKEVIAVEPIARNIHYLLANIKNNGWARQTEVFPVALADGRGILQMWGGGTGASLIEGWASIPQSYVTQVPVLTLDRVLDGALSGKKALILVDVEGAECMMLSGARQTLKATPRPIWMMEISATEHQPTGITVNPHFRETFSVFADNGYRAYAVDQLDRELTDADLNLRCRPSEVAPNHNYIFR